jgi:ABC-2 type transport system permease protein
VNTQHLRAFLWLRWRLFVNQLTKGGTVNLVLFILMMCSVAVLAAVLFVGSFLVGWLLLPQVPAGVLLFVWDGLVLVFLFCWMIGLIHELQRADVLSLDKFLHLPVSVVGAFLVNYVSSLLSVNLFLFLPAMIGLTLGLVFGVGPAMVLAFPLLAAFVLMVTAVTYQFQGWLAALMVNPRRRRTVIVVVTMSFILLFQLPNLINILRPWPELQRDERGARLTAEQAELDRALAAKEINWDEFSRRREEIGSASKAQTEASDQQAWQQVQRTTRLINLLLPPGWLPLGADALAEGNVLPALLATVGLSLLGTASLWRAYQTTVRYYKGQWSSGKSAPAPVAAAAKTAKPPANLLERDLPWLSEQTAAVALGAFRSLTRAPEGKMLLLSPALVVLIFGSILLAHRLDMPEAVRPLMAFGVMAMILLTFVGLVGNQFGFDRGGFRVLVLSPAPRRDILLGKNLAFASVALTLGLVLAALLQIIYPMRLDHFLATVVQFLSMYLLFCLPANMLSILAPMQIAPGSFKPAHPRLVAILLQLLFIFVFPFVLLPTLLPLGVELLVESLGGPAGLPLALALSVLECVAVVYLYRLVLTWEGHLLQMREQKILDLVTAKAE